MKITSIDYDSFHSILINYKGKIVASNDNRDNCVGSTYDKITMLCHITA